MNEIKNNIIIFVTDYINEIIEYTSKNKKKELAETFMKKDWILDNDKYIKRLDKYCNCDHICLLVALVYVDRIHRYYNFNIKNIQLLYGVTYILSIKFMEDYHYDNKFFSEVLSIPLKHLNKMEKIVLKYLNYNLNINYSKFMKFYDTLLS